MILQQRDLAVLAALHNDRSDCGQGLTRAELARIGETRWPERSLRRLREAGHQIASVGVGEESERYQLLGTESERAGDQVDSGTSIGKDDQACAPRPVDGSLSARLFDLPAAPHYDVRAAA